MPNTILIQGGGVQAERLAGGAITPGMLMDVNSSDAFIVHGTASGAASPLFALEFAEVGREITDAYASGETCIGLYAKPGSVIYALLKTGNNAAIGDELASDGAGALLKPTVDASLVEGAIIARAEEAVNNSSGSNARIKVRIV